jgi:TRAP-type C4-dicarboxylate transport system substrate-binding protein
MWRVLDGEIGDEFIQALEDYGLRGLSWFDAGARSLYFVEKITKLEELEGKRIRVAQSDLMEDLIYALGGIPVRMDYAYVYNALELNRIDGAENNWPSFEFAEHYKVAPYVFLSEHNRIPEILLVSPVTWRKLTRSDQEIIAESAIDAAIYQRELWSIQEEKSRQMVEGLGVVTVELSDEQLEELIRRVYTLHESYEDLIERIQKIR